MIPQNLLLLAIRPRILFPVNGGALFLFLRSTSASLTHRDPPVIWGMLTAASAAVTKVEHLYVIKFFQGTAIHSVLGWTQAYPVAVDCRSRRGVHLRRSGASFSLRSRPGNLGLRHSVFLS